MKASVLVALVLFAPHISFAAPADAALDQVCAQCTRIKMITKKFETLSGYEESKATPMIREATAAVSKLPVQTGGLFTPEQVLAVSQMMYAAYKFDNDPDHSIIDGNLKRFQRNQKLFFKTFATFDATAEQREIGKRLREGLEAKLDEAKYGQDERRNPKLRSDPDAEPVDPDSIEPIVAPKSKSKAK